MKRNAFLRHFIVLLGGTAASQVILIAITPVLTWLYTPADFGFLGALTGVLSVLTILSSFRYAQVLTIVNSEAERHNILVLCNAITVFNVALSAVLIGLFGELTLSRFDLSVDPIILWLVPLGFLFVGLQNTYRLLHIGRRNFRVVAASQVAKTMATVVLQLALFMFGAIGISIGYVLGFGFAVLVMLVPAIREVARSSEISLADMRSVAYRYRDFPIYSSWAGLINNFSQYLPHFLFPFYFGAAGTGFFLLANRMTFAPVSLVVTTTADVLTPYAAAAKREGRLDVLVLAAIKNLSVLVSIPAVLIAVIAPLFFPILFGEEWALSGELTTYLAIAVFFNAVGNPISRIIPILERQGVGLGFNVVMFVTRGVAIVAGGAQDSVVLATLYFSIVSASVWCGYILLIGHLSGVSWVKALALIIRSVLFPVAAFLPYWLADFFNAGDSLSYAFIGLGCFAVAVYGVFAARHGFSVTIENSKLTNLETGDRIE